MSVDRTQSGSATAADPIAASPVYPAGSRVNERGHLEIAGCDLVELADRFGTPAYIYSEDDIRGRTREYVRTFEERTDAFEVIYASKALPATAAYRVMREEGLSVDVASGGELRMALAAGFDPARIHLHGNNKTEAELSYAFEAGVGHLILDSFDEIERAEWLLERPQRVLIRVTPGIKPSTHDYVQTGQLDSKFGFGLGDRLAEQAVERVRESAHLELVGLHAHIGSQIFELDPYVKAIEVIADFCDGRRPPARAAQCRRRARHRIPGHRSTARDRRLRRSESRRGAAGLRPAARILVEPGRSLVGNAGVTAYRVGTVKEIPGVRTYVAVDGGMSDNLRPMLYGAHYEAVVADRAGEAPDTLATVAGMHCESGDVLVRDTGSRSQRPADLLVTPATGAYGYAMANNYNGVPRPPVIFCREGDARVVVRRETWDDLLARDE
jgi:diaminopimelate decarboxylase